MSGGLQLSLARRLGAFRLEAELSCPPGQVTALFGPSGAGKSQLLAAVAGAARPDRGRIVLDGRVLFDADSRIDLPMERRGIGWVFQDGRLFPHLSVEANLRYGAKRTGGRDAGVRFETVVEALGLAPLLQRRPGGLSGGERQRVAIARALLAQPALLLMDEPLAALDLPRREEILPYLERLRAVAALPILYVTHALGEVVRLAGRLALMEDGRVVAEGPLAAVMSRTDLPLLARRPDACAVLEAIADGVEGGLLRLRLEGGANLLVPARRQLPPGARLRVAVLARDVLIATQRPIGLSARNILVARLEAMGSPDAEGVVAARLRLPGGQALVSAITADAAAVLALAPGQDVYAIIKSVAVEGAGVGLLRHLEL